MKITQLRVDHLENPLGYRLENPVFSFVCEQTPGKKLSTARVQISLDEAFSRIVHDSGESPLLDPIAYYAPGFEPVMETRYFWRAWALSDAGDSAWSECSWFETGLKSFDADWITAVEQNERPVSFVRTFSVNPGLVSARAYVCGLGLYELSVNGRKVGEECLAPGFHVYDSWLQYQTYDIAQWLSAEGENEIEALVADGWYCGRFGFQGQRCIYGKEKALICQIVLRYQDGARQIIATDTQWRCRVTNITFAGIYDGEWQDDRVVPGDGEPVLVSSEHRAPLCPRLSPPITAHERISPIEAFVTPKDEQMLDMGQNMVGWLEMRIDEPVGREIVVSFGEVLENGCFYNANLRSAKQEFRFISAGAPRVVRQHFTFYGFRYVRISGLSQAPDPSDFCGIVLYSAMDRSGRLETSDPLINRLYENALWGQKGNFLDVPTDCPQRDERMGWTGDAQAFSGTALYNMHAAAFFRKYLWDMRMEQQKLGGSVPFVVPMAGLDGHASAAWGDAATVIPWNLYLHTGDLKLLDSLYDNMTMWVDYILSRDTEGKRLWVDGFHFGDWLALDNFYDPKECIGGTDIYYIASCYYCYSARLTSLAARALGKREDEQRYTRLADEVRDAIRREYFTPSGRLSVDTQTAHVIALFMDITPSPDRTALRLSQLLSLNGGKLNTGFVGTTYLLLALSASGQSQTAYSLLMNREYPGWLYEVLLGATTVWERWNSLAPDGSLGDTSMNSFNHYAYGSVVEWMYRDMLGIAPLADAPGFRRVLFAPKPDARLSDVRGRVNTAAGEFISSWSYQNGSLRIRLSVPFNAEADVLLPGKMDTFRVCAGEHEWTIVQ